MTTSLLDLTDPDPDSGPKGPEGVGVLRRGLARLVDLGVVGGVWLVAAPVAFLLAFAWADFFGPPAYAALEKLMADSDSRGLLVGATIVERLVTLAAIVVMHSLWEGLHGSTPGKRLCGITVVSEDGAPASLVAGIKRSVAFLVDQIGCGLLGAYRINESPRSQRIGDDWADTVVVRIRDQGPGSRRAPLRFAAAILAGLLAGGAVVVLGVSARIVHHTRLGARDQVTVVSALQKPPGPFRAGETVAFVVSATFALESAPLGTLRLFVLDGDVSTPAGQQALRRGRGLTNFEAPVKIPEHRPGYSQPGVVRLGVALFPARNVHAPSAHHELEIQIVPCDPMAAGETAGQLCTG